MGDENYAEYYNIDANPRNTKVDDHAAAWNIDANPRNTQVAPTIAAKKALPEKQTVLKQSAKKVESNPQPLKTDEQKETLSSEAPFTAESIYRPSLYYNYSDQYPSHVWIRLTAKPIEKQAAWARADKGPITAGAKRFEINFLAPNEIQEIVSHEWGPYESVASKIAEKAASLGRFEYEFKNLQNQWKKYKERADKNRSLTGQTVSKIVQAPMDTLHQLAVAGSQADIRQQRIDTALVYKNSERRKYDFVFYLADIGVNLYDEVIYPVKLLQYLSSPSKDNDRGNASLADIKAPFFFELSTWPKDYIRVKYAACTLVQPTWKGPYIKGLPSSCELHLSFVEIEPLWDSMFVDDKRITSSTRFDNAAKTFATPSPDSFGSGM